AAAETVRQPCGPGRAGGLRERYQPGLDLRPAAGQPAEMAEILQESIRHVDGGRDDAGERQSEAGHRYAVAAAQIAAGVVELPERDGEAERPVPDRAGDPDLVAGL